MTQSESSRTQSDGIQLSYCKTRKTEFSENPNRLQGGVESGAMSHINNWEEGRNKTLGWKAFLTKKEAVPHQRG